MLGSGAVTESDGVWPAGSLKKATTGICSVVSEEYQDVGYWAHETPIRARAKNGDSGVMGKGKRIKEKECTV